MRDRCQRGFTLLEMVVAVLLTGILAALLALILSGPMRAWVDVGRRAELTDLAETALARMTRELRLALPNSLRIATGPDVVALEMLRTLDGGRYRAAPESGPPPACGPAPAGDPLEFTCADASFDVVGQLARLGQIAVGADCAAAPASADCVVVYNLGALGANDAYAGDNLATVTALGDDAASDGSDRLTVGNARLDGGQPAFPLASPSRRFHVVDTPVSFVCSLASGTVTRFADYPIGAVQPLAPAGASGLLVNNVIACSFAYDPGTATRSGLVTLRLTLTEPGSGENVTLLQQAHVSNQP